MTRRVERVLGKYEIVDLLGTTSLASVYRARETATGKVVALKLLHDYLSGDETPLQTFLDGMAQVQLLQHPNIVPVQGVERQGRDMAVVMDYVPWPTLKATASASLPVPEILGILRQVAAALDFAHAQGIVHRDLRPSNVFYDRASGSVLVSDFGTYKLVEIAHPLVRSTTNTPAAGYAAPEQLQGKPPDPRNDVYSLGVLAYELLTGEIPYDALSPHTLLARQLTSIPTPPSELNDAIPPEFDRVLLRALRRRPEERYQSCTEMVSALEQVAGAHTPAGAPTHGRAQAAGPGREVLAGGLAPARKEEDGRVVCPRCGSGNPATASHCNVCWGSLVAQPIVTREEEQGSVRAYLAKLRRRKLLTRTVLGGAVAALILFWAANQLDLRLPLPPPSSSISSESASGEWSMVQRDINHTGVVPGPAFSPSGTIKWRFKSEESLLSSPAVARGRVYVTTGDRRVVALDKDTGEPLWTYAVTGPINATPVVADDLVYVGLRDRRLLALDADTNVQTGELRWEVATGNPVYGSPTVVDGALYLGSTDGRLYSVDARTGQIRWMRELTNWITSSPAISQGIAVMGDQQGELFLFNASNGSLRNQLRLSGGGISSPTVVGDLAYMATRPGYVVAYRYTQRNIPFQEAVWSWWLQLYFWRMAPTPVFPPGLVWSTWMGASVVGDIATSDGRVYAATVKGDLYALDLATGKSLWKAEKLGNLYSSPVVSGNSVIVAAANGKIHGVDASTGELQWAVSVEGTVISAIVLADGTLYVPTIQGTLYAIQ
ncbi:MAG: PQQ-binding-like beta-propeller repeat protein [Chloroflexi bacterium]|nr:PQQ-binding-like beta-propeller repeat protein [Chloroflexota bacterium]